MYQRTEPFADEQFYWFQRKYADICKVHVLIYKSDKSDKLIPDRPVIK